MSLIYFLAGLFTLPAALVAYLTYKSNTRSEECSKEVFTINCDDAISVDINGTKSQYYTVTITELNQSFLVPEEQVRTVNGVRMWGPMRDTQKSE